MPSNTPSPTGLPTPRLTLTPSKAGYPADGGSLDLLVRLGVDLPHETVERAPLALALVLDRSGSMSGAPLEGAKAAACSAIEMLLPDDWVSVVAFDTEVRVVAPLAVAGSDRTRLLAAVRAIGQGGSTALFGGWAEGLSQVMTCPVADAGVRIVLLTDGQANVGITDVPTITADVSRATAHGVTTTTMGFGRNYDEHLLRSMADAGKGNYVFIEDQSQVTEAFQHELAGLSTLRGRDVRLEASAGMTLTSYVADRLPSYGTGVRLPDLVAGLDRDIVLTASFTAGTAQPEVTLVWTDLLSGAEERLTVPLGLEPVGREAFAAMPERPEVASSVALARIAALKLDLAQAFRSGAPGAPAPVLTALTNAVSALPHGEERALEERELRRLLALERERDASMAARLSERGGRDRAYGTSDLKRMALYERERALNAKKTRSAHESSAVGRERAPADATTLAGVTLVGPGGTVAVSVSIGDITTQDVDVLVNSTNRNLFGNAGVDGAVHRRGGPELTLAARQLGPLAVGQAVFTPGFGLPARYVVHAVAKPWADGTRGEIVALTQAYRSAFDVASQLGARTLAVTALGTGMYGVPAQVSAHLATTVLREVVLSGVPFTEVRFVILDSAVARTFAAWLPLLTATAESSVPASVPT